MEDHLIVLGVAPQSQERRLSAGLAIATGTPESPSVKVLTNWQGAAGASIPRQLFTVAEVLINLIDNHNPRVVALRRPETAGRGGPTLSYDDKVALMSVAALIAIQRSLAYADYRGGQLRYRADSATVTQHVAANSRGKRDPLHCAATAAALTALSSGSFER